MRLVFVVLLIINLTMYGQKKFIVFNKEGSQAFKEKKPLSPKVLIPQCSGINIIDSVSLDTSLWFNQYLLKAQFNDSIYYIENAYITKYKFNCKIKNIKEFALLNKGSVFFKKKPLESKSYSVTHEVKFYNSSIDEAYFLLKYFYDEEYMILPIKAVGLSDNIKITYRRKYKKVKNLKLVYEYDGGTTSFIINEKKGIVNAYIIFSPD